MSDKNRRPTFDEATLASLGERTLDQLTAAIEANDTELATQLANRMYEEFQGMHDLYLNWTTALMTFIGRHYGDKELEKAIKETVAYYRKVGFSGFDLAAYAAVSDKELIESFAQGLRGHLQPFKIKEQEDCYEILLENCGSGARLIQRGAYEGADALLKVKGPSSMTYNQDEWPVYCAHCHFESQPLPGWDKPLYQIIATDKPGHGTCIIRMPKRV